MKLLYVELMELQVGLSIIAKIEGIKDFRLKTVLARNLKKISAELTDIYEIERMKLIECYAKHDAEGRMVFISNNIIDMEDQQSFNNEFKKLQKTVVEIDLEMFTQKELEVLPENVQDKLTAEVLAYIMPILICSDTNNQ